MKNRKLTALAAAALVSVGAGQAQAADIAPPPETSGWTFAAAAYLWAAGLEGESGLFGLPPQDIDVSFSDVVENLEFGFMGLGEARNGRFSIGMDLVYAKLGIDIDTPAGILVDSIDVTVETLMATGVAGYALVDTGTSHLDVIAGARLWWVNNEFDFDGGALDGSSADDGATWVDPLVGAKFRADLGSHFYASGWGMIGGFGVSSDFMWDALGGLGYQVSDGFSVFGGYRATGVDYSNDGFVYDVVQHGPIFAGVFRF